MSDNPFASFFRDVEETMRGAGHGAMVDRALHNARASLLALLRAELERRRERQFVKGVVMERLSSICRDGRALGFFQ